MKKIIIVLTTVLLAILALNAKDKDEKFQKVMDSRTPDQIACSGANIEFPDAEKDKFVKEQMVLIKKPAGNKYLGDHKNGRKIFVDAAKGNCYACHCGESSESACGSIAPSLKNFAKADLDPDYVYQRVYNSWSILPCSAMPRFGVHGTLTPEEVADVVGYLMDKNSPLNK